MNNEKLVEVLNKIPVGLVAAIFAMYLGFDYYNFTTGSDSPLIQKQTELLSLRKENQALQVKIKQAADFFRSFEAKKLELRKLAQDLQELKGTISNDVDVSSFMKMIVTEAKKVGLTVVSLKPSPVAKKEYYEEQPFELKFTGVYVQLLVFLDRLSNLQNIVRVDDFDIHPQGSSASRYVELEGTVSVKTFKYVGTQADAIGKPDSSSPGAKAPGGGTTSGSGAGDKKGDGQ